MAPHIAYVTVGKDNRFLLPASALLGALLLAGADTVVRTIMAPVICRCDNKLDWRPAVHLSANKNHNPPDEMKIKNAKQRGE